MPELDPLAAFRLDGRVAVVTGASSGLGARFARVLHAAGARVVVAARRADRLGALAAELPGSVPVAVDVGDGDARARLVERALEATAGQVDVLVNCAGTGTPAALADEPLDGFQRTLEVNLVAGWHLTQLLAPALAAGGHGSVVNISSIAAAVAMSPIHHGAYVASKGGVEALTRELAVQLADRGVRVNAIAPGWFATEMTAEMTDERSQAFVARGTPLRRMGVDGELDGALLLLASDAGSFITGSVLTVDGGWTAR